LVLVDWRERFEIPRVREICVQLKSDSHADIMYSDKRGIKMTPGTFTCKIPHPLGKLPILSTPWPACHLTPL